MGLRTGVLSAIAAVATAAAVPAAAQGYGFEQYCYFVNGVLRCERQQLVPRGYMGDQKWCLYRDGTLGNTALCSYASYRLCLTGKLNTPGRCILNPDYAEGIAPPPPSAKRPANGERR